MSDSEMPAAIRDMPEQQQRWYTLGWQAAIARFARPTPTPIPVSERPWEREGWCDAEGWCWFYTPRGDWVRAVLPVSPAYTHCLPAHALPLPAAPGEAKP